MRSELEAWTGLTKKTHDALAVVIVTLTRIFHIHIHYTYQQENKFTIHMSGELSYVFHGERDLTGMCRGCLKLEIELYCGIIPSVVVLTFDS